MSFIFSRCLNYRKSKRRSNDNEKIRVEVQNIISKAVKIVQEAKDSNDNKFLNKSEASRGISIYFNRQPVITKNISTDNENITCISSFFDEASMDEQFSCHELESNGPQYPSTSKSPIDIFELQNGIDGPKTKLGCLALPLRSPSPEGELSHEFLSKVSTLQKVNRLLPDYQNCKDYIKQDDCETGDQQKVLETSESGSAPCELDKYLSDRNVQLESSSLNSIIGEIGHSEYKISKLVGPSSKPSEQGDTKNLYYDDEGDIERSEINSAIGEDSVYECRICNHSRLASKSVCGEAGNINARPRTFRRLTKKSCDADKRC